MCSPPAAVSSPLPVESLLCPQIELSAPNSKIHKMFLHAHSQGLEIKHTKNEAILSKIKSLSSGGLMVCWYAGGWEHSP